MKKALISPNETQIEYVSSWVLVDGEYTPVMTHIDDACRVAQVVEINEEFPISPPLYWTDCDDNVKADDYYFNTTNNTIVQLPESAPRPSNPV
jgi:hypothetical protein